MLRGGVLMSALCKGARPPADVDFAIEGVFDEHALSTCVREIVALDDEQTVLQVDEIFEIWPGTPFPGLRALLSGRSARGDARMQVDLGFGDPHAVPPRDVNVPGVGMVLSCAPETLFGWKLHGLVEHGRGRWRAKDLFDLHLLLTIPLDPEALGRAVELAFSSRDLPLAALDDFLDRESWGVSHSGERKWRTLQKRHSATPPFLDAREPVKRRVAALLRSKA